MRTAQRKIWSALFVVTLSVSIGVQAAERPSHYGLALPYLHNVPDFVPAKKMPYFRIERLVRMILDIDKKGQVTRVTPENPSDTGFVRYTEAWIKSLSFEPALFKGKKVSSLLPLAFQFRPRVKLPDIYFPIDTSGAIIDADLYFEAFVLNDIRLPYLEEFPSYFCDMKLTDSSVVLKYVLLRLEFDETGSVVNIEEIHSTFETYTMSIMSAVLWADFSPAAVKGTPISSECFMLVSFFSQVNYPTRVWQRSHLDSLSLLDRFRVRLLFDTVGLMVKPLPASASGDFFTLRVGHLMIRDSVSAVLFIDASGRPRLGRFSRTSKETLASVHEIVSHLKFYPALDYEGQSHPFTGLVTFVFQGSLKNRIVYHWLPKDHSFARD